MAWIEQTKKGSRKSGGPQYYLQDLSENTSAMLQHARQRPVRLWTPYGVVDSGLTAVSRVVGKVGHDRFQSGRRVPSIAAQIAHWFTLKQSDIETLEFEDSLDGDAFVVKPSSVKFVRRRAKRSLYPDQNPLTLIRGHRSSLLMQHLDAARRESWHEWTHSQIATIVEQHSRVSANVDERDLLRASGALDRIGVALGMYRRGGIDCPDAVFSLGGYPEYACPIEIEERSSGFLAAHHRVHRSGRAVLLCMTHDAPRVLTGYIDVIELRELARVFREAA